MKEYKQYKSGDKIILKDSSSRRSISQLSDVDFRLTDLKLPQNNRATIRGFFQHLDNYFVFFEECPCHCYPVEIIDSIDFSDINESKCDKFYNSVDSDLRQAMNEAIQDSGNRREFETGSGVMIK